MMCRPQGPCHPLGDSQVLARAASAAGLAVSGDRFVAHSYGAWLRSLETRRSPQMRSHLRFFERPMETSSPKKGPGAVRFGRAITSLRLSSQATISGVGQRATAELSGRVRVVAARRALQDESLRRRREGRRFCLVMDLKAPIPVENFAASPENNAGAGPDMLQRFS